MSVSHIPTNAMSASGFRLPSDQPISENERAWIDFLRLVSCDSDPAPTLRCVQAMRQLVGECVNCEHAGRAGDGRIT